MYLSPSNWHDLASQVNNCGYTARWPLSCQSDSRSSLLSAAAPSTMHLDSLLPASDVDT